MMQKIKCKSLVHWVRSMSGLSPADSEQWKKSIIYLITDVHDEGEFQLVDHNFSLFIVLSVDEDNSRTFINHFSTN